MLRCGVIKYSDKNDATSFLIIFYRWFRIEDIKYKWKLWIVKIGIIENGVNI